MQTQLQIKQRELLELKKRKLEMELAQTKKHIEEGEKALSLTTSTISSTVVSSPQPDMTLSIENPLPMQPCSIGLNVPQVIIVLNGLLELIALAIIVLLLTKENTLIISQAINAPPLVPVPQMINANARQRIAPVNAALLSSVRSRDPRLMRQTGAQSMSLHTQQMQPPLTTTSTFNGAQHRIPSNFNNNNINNHNQIPPQKFLPTVSILPFKSQSSINAAPNVNENASKEIKENTSRRDGKTSSRSSSSKFSSKSSGSSSGKPTSTSGSSKSTSSTHKSSSSSRSSNSSKNSGSRSSKSSISSSSSKSSSSASSKSKDRSDEHGSLRKYCSLISIYHSHPNNEP